DIQIMKAPVEYTAGVQKKFDNGFLINAGAGGALNDAVGNPTFRGVLTFGYSPNGKIRGNKKKVEIEKIEKRKTKEKRRKKVGVVVPETLLTIVYFPEGLMRPTDESLPWIKDTAVWFQERGFTRVQITGYVNGRENRLNSRLALKRAKEIKRRLVNLGIDPTQIEVTTQKQGTELTPQTSQEERLSRRAQIVLQ
ncbi:MAG: OmpA family protein, partial [bacterium]|nr:OmpA family protein [bacterium]